jgi:hypothetical protein
MDYFFLIRDQKSFYSRSYIIILGQRRREKETFIVTHFDMFLVLLIMSN